MKELEAHIEAREKELRKRDMLKRRKFMPPMYRFYDGYEKDLALFGLLLDAKHADLLRAEFPDKSPTAASLRLTKEQKEARNRLEKGRFYFEHHWYRAASEFTLSVYEPLFQPAKGLRGCSERCPDPCNSTSRLASRNPGPLACNPVSLMPGAYFSATDVDADCMSRVWGQEHSKDEDEWKHI